MAKDPAFLFYSKDFYTGVATMSFEDRGKYISILCLMHQQGRMDEETIRFLVGSVSVTLKSKFEVDENGLWFNVKLESEIEKRIKFTESRRSNGIKGGRPKPSGYPSAEPSGKPTDNLAVNANPISSENVFKAKKEKKISTKVVEEIFNPIDHIPESWDRDQFVSLWTDFEKMRIKEKRPLSTNRAIKGCFDDLIKFSDGSYQKAEEIVLNAIKRNWLTFYELKPSANSPKPQNGHDPRYSATFVKDKA